METTKQFFYDDEPDWEHRRYEIAKAMLPSFYKRFEGPIDWQCELAVRYADKLIQELQKPKKQ